MNAPTRTQSHTLAIIASQTLMRGRAPTQAELSAALGITRQAVCERLAWMRKKGLLRVNHDRWSGTSRITREGVREVVQSVMSRPSANCTSSSSETESASNTRRSGSGASKQLLHVTGSA